ncbi:hypothetical protein T11_3012, partial [Trichinella zimbabwensis]
MKIAMAMSHGKLIFVLFVVFNVTLVRSVFNQTNETDVGAVKSLDEIREYERTSNANGMNMNEIVDEQQVVKEIVDLLRAKLVEKVTEIGVKPEIFVCFIIKSARKTQALLCLEVNMRLEINDRPPTVITHQCDA